MTQRKQRTQRRTRTRSTIPFRILWLSHQIALSNFLFDFRLRRGHACCALCCPHPPLPTPAPLFCLKELLFRMSSSESEVQTKKRKRSSSSAEGDASLLAPIATPLADKKLTKHLLKLVKKSMYFINLLNLIILHLYSNPFFEKHCSHVNLAIEAKELKRGVKQCVKFIRKEDPATKKQR